MKILVGIDGSDRSFHALKFVAKITNPDVDSFLLYFSPPSFRCESSTNLPTAVGEEATVALAKVVFERAKSHLTPAQQKLTRVHFDTTPPAEGLLKLAEAEDVDLIVVAAHGARRTLTLFVGGTTRHVAHLAAKPVLVVRDSKETSDPGLKILLACDERRWQAAVPLLDRLAWPQHTATTLFHVVESLSDGDLRNLLEEEAASIPYFAELMREHDRCVAHDTTLRAEEMRVKHSAVPRLLEQADVEVVQGHPVERIIQKVETDAIDLVIVGARKLGPIGRLLGSTTEALLVRCPCSLLIVHEHTV